MPQLNLSLYIQVANTLNVSQNRSFTPTVSDFVHAVLDAICAYILILVNLNKQAQYNECCR